MGFGGTTLKEMAFERGCPKKIKEKGGLERNSEPKGLLPAIRLNRAVFNMSVETKSRLPSFCFTSPVID